MKRAILTNLMVIVFVLCSIVICQGAEKPLINITPDFDVSKIVTADAQVALLKPANKTVLSVTTGTAQQYPGITLKPDSGSWDLSAFDRVIITVKNISNERFTLFCRVDNPGADGSKNCVTGNASINPGQTQTITVRLARYTEDRLDGKLFGMRGYPKKMGGPGTIDPSNIVQVLVFVSKPSRKHSFEIESIVASGTFVMPTAFVTDADPYFPFIDTFGQYKHKNWHGKTESIEDLKAKHQQELRELAEFPGQNNWDKYGGWAKGPRLQATGFFRTEKYNGKWWLVDPDGYLFFSHGIDCVRMFETTVIEERQDWFEQFPGKQPEFQEFFGRSSVLKGHYAGRTVRTFSFASANLLRKYGSDWRQVYPEIIHKRLRSWGINTIGNWSDEQVRLMRKTPYVDTISSGRTPRIQGSEGYWGKFPDVFHPEFRNSLRNSMASKKGKSAGDPYCIGFFSDNELAWGDEYSLAIGALKSPPDQPAKIAFINKLKAKYSTIEQLNKIWSSTYETWDALSNSQQAPDRNKAKDDLLSFYTDIAEQYFRVTREVVKEFAPEQLYLGCRFAWVNSLAASAAAKYCDVVSYNLYRRNVADFKFNGGKDVPLLIGEFHFGALDRGMFHTGLVPCASQQERADSYYNYVKSVIEHPSFVGCHWFQYQDQPTTGRALDEENYQIGFVDIADTPYPEIINASRKVSELMYKK